MTKATWTLPLASLAATLALTTPGFGQNVVFDFESGTIADVGGSPAPDYSGPSSILADSNLVTVALGEGGDGDADQELLITTDGGFDATTMRWNAFENETGIVPDGTAISGARRTLPILSYEATVVDLDPDGDGTDVSGALFAAFSIQGFSLPTDAMGGTFGGFKTFTDLGVVGGSIDSFLPASVGATKTVTVDLENDFLVPMYLPTLSPNPPFSQFYFAFFNPGGSQPYTIAIDNVTFSERIPEPTSAAIVLATLGLAATCRRAR